MHVCNSKQIVSILFAEQPLLAIKWENMQNLKALIAKRAKLEAQIAEARKQGRREAIATIKRMMIEYGMVLADVAGPESESSGRRSRKPFTGERKKVAAKYRDAAGNTWSGRGLQPRWLSAALAEGKPLSDFAV